MQKAYPGKQPPPAASGEAENRPPTEPKAYKEMLRKPIPEACRPASLPMPGFLTPPPKARPRTPGSTPRTAAKAPPATVYADVPKQPASSNPTPVLTPAKASPRDQVRAQTIKEEVGDFIAADAKLRCDFHQIKQHHIPPELLAPPEPDEGLTLPDISIFVRKSFFENKDQPPPRKGQGSVFKQDQANSAKFWGTGYYCLFCKLKNKNSSRA